MRLYFVVWECKILQRFMLAVEFWFKYIKCFSMICGCLSLRMRSESIHFEWTLSLGSLPFPSLVFFLFSPHRPFYSPNATISGLGPGPLTHEIWTQPGWRHPAASLCRPRVPQVGGSKQEDSIQRKLCWGLCSIQAPSIESTKMNPIIFTKNLKTRCRSEWKAL